MEPNFLFYKKSEKIVLLAAVVIFALTGFLLCRQLAGTEDSKLYRIVIALMITFSCMLIAFVSAVIHFIREYDRGRTELLFEQTRNNALIKELGIDLLIYDAKNYHISLQGNLHRQLSLPDELYLKDLIRYKYLQKRYDIDSVIESVRKCLSTGTTQRRLLLLAGNPEPRWIDFTFVRYETIDGMPHVFGFLQDVSGDHQDFASNRTMLLNSPAGVHRCYLSDPIHLEYFSDGLCRMLGYTETEFLSVIDWNNYSKVICEEDRPDFEEFVTRLGKEELTDSCEYRMIRKDGSLITVIDTMESVRGANGIMYGYSAVFNITEKEEELKRARQQIRDNEAKEQLLLEEQRKLSVAAKNAYSMIISLDIKENTYYMVEEASRIVTIPEKGSCDELLAKALTYITDDKEKETFRELFFRESLMAAKLRGEKVVSLRQKAMGSDSKYHWFDVQAFFMDGDREEFAGSNSVIMLVRNADNDQSLIEQLRYLLTKQSVYYDALMSNSVGYMEVNLTTGYIQGDIIDSNAGGELHSLRIPELEPPILYDDFEKWWADHMLTEDPETFLNLSNCRYLLSQYEKGNRYHEVQCKTRNFSEDIREWHQMYFLSSDPESGDIMAICLLYDITDQQADKKEIEELTRQLTESRIRNSVRQMQPHFLYNALAAIREIILDDPQYASDLILDFTTHLRSCVRSMTNNDLVPFDRELDSIRAYVNIERMRFGDSLKVDYDIECSDFMIVPLSIQPLVENSIRHGIYERGSKGGTVTVKTRRTADSVVVTVSDDGVGFDYDQVRHEIAMGERDSTGLSNLIFRLDKIIGAKVKIDSKPGEGTDITITIPDNKEASN